MVDERFDFRASCGLAAAARHAVVAASRWAVLGRPTSTLAQHRRTRLHPGWSQRHRAPCGAPGGGQGGGRSRTTPFRDVSRRKRALQDRTGCWCQIPRPLPRDDSFLETTKNRDDSKGHDPGESEAQSSLQSVRWQAVFQGYAHRQPSLHHCALTVLALRHKTSTPSTQEELASLRSQLVKTEAVLAGLQDRCPG